MCAIFGFIRQKGSPSPDKIILKRIVEENISRGPHAFGFAWIDSRGRIMMYKQRGSLLNHLDILAAASHEAIMFIGHLRWATHGSPGQNVNNHPHASDGGWIVHNGIVSNYRELMLENGLLPTSECDSEVLGMMIASNPSPDLGVRCKETIDDVELNSSLCMMGLWKKPSRMIVARRGNPLYSSCTSRALYIATYGHSLPGKPSMLDDNSLWVLGESAKLVDSMKLAHSRRRDAANLFQHSIAYKGAYRGG